MFGLFCSSFVRIYGQAPQQLGALLATVQILSLDRGIPSSDRGRHSCAPRSSAAPVGDPADHGASGESIRSCRPGVRWPRPTARLSELVRDLARLLQTPDITDAAWEAHARIHRRATREAIEAARTAMMDTVRARGAASNRAAQAVIRLETADQIFGGLIALSDMLEHSAASGAPHSRTHVLRRMRPVLLTLGRVVVSDDPEAHRRIDRAIDAIVADQGRLPGGAPLRAVFDLIIERLRIAHTLAVPANLVPGADRQGRPPPLWQRLIRPLRANLNWKSPALRHALAHRGCTARFRLAFTMVWFTPYDHWLTITVVATMQPYFSLTYTRAVERIVGTALGGIIAGGVGLICTTPVSIAAAMFLLSVAAFAVRAVSFGLFMLALTPLVVLLVETGAPDTGEWMIAAARAALTTLGGVVAVGANFLLWPSREPDLLAAEVKQSDRRPRRLRRSRIFRPAGRGDGAQLDQARRAAGVVEQRAGGADHPRTAGTRQAVSRSAGGGDGRRCRLAPLRRTAGNACSTITTASRLPPPTLQAWRKWVTASLRALASGSTTLLPRPAGVEAETLVRIARQIELMAGAMRRLP